VAAGDADLVKDADILVRDSRTRRSHGDHPGVHAQQAFDHRIEAGLLGDLPDHSIEGILPVLDRPPGRVQWLSPVGGT
jgi:hypothetical protein